MPDAWKCRAGRLWISAILLLNSTTLWAEEPFRNKDTIQRYCFNSEVQSDNYKKYCLAYLLALSNRLTKWEKISLPKRIILNHEYEIISSIDIPEFHEFDDSIYIDDRIVLLQDLWISKYGDQSGERFENSKIANFDNKPIDINKENRNIMKLGESAGIWKWKIRPIETGKYVIHLVSSIAIPDMNGGYRALVTSTDLDYFEASNDWETSISSWEVFWKRVERIFSAPKSAILAVSALIASVGGLIVALKKFNKKNRRQY